MEKEAARLPLIYLELGGGSLLALANNEPAGFVAWRALPVATVHEAWEMKRLWVCPRGRGFGVGRTLTQAVLDRAAAAGRKAVYLETVPAAMAPACRLYERMGFVPCPPYDGNSAEGVVYLVKRL